MKIQDRYRWEAQLANGDVITKGGGLAAAARFSLIPGAKTGLPRHDISGIPMIRRFARCYQKVTIGQHTLGALCWETGSRWIATPHDLQKELIPGDMIRKNKIAAPESWSMVEAVYPEHICLIRPYEGKTARFNTVKNIRNIDTEYVHCVVCKGFRIWIRSTDGAVLLTPQDYELWL
jgi:hypothetical protein